MKMKNREKQNLVETLKNPLTIPGFPVPERRDKDIEENHFNRANKKIWLKTENLRIF